MTRSFAKTTPIKMLMHPINDQGGGQYRILHPASLLRRHGYAVAQAHRSPVTSEALTVLDPDVVVFQLWQTDQHIETIKRYRKTLPKAHFVYEIDDLFWAVPEGSFHRSNPLLPKAKSQIRTAAKLCDSIVCTTDLLAKEMKKLTSMRDVRVMRNEVPRSFINAALAGRRSDDTIKSDKPRVGWAGGIGHGGDLQLITDVMKLLGDEVHWVFLGMVPPGVDPQSVEFHQGVPFADYAYKLGTLNLDLALAPLELNEFNFCKSDLRVLEYGAAGFPVIASDISTYADCPHVIRVPNIAEAWAAVIRAELADRDSLGILAEVLHQWTTTERCMDDHLGVRLRSLLPRGVEPFIPMTHTSHIGELVSVGAEIDGLDTYASVQEAWAASPGADIVYVRPNTSVNAAQVGRMMDSLGTHASVSAITNDGIYPVFGKFVRLPHKVGDQLDFAAYMANHEPISAPFPAGPCVVLSGTALARFGLPDEARFGHLEFALADWGARCCEGGRGHVTAVNTFIHTEDGLQQVPALAKHALEHLSMWSPGYVSYIQAYQIGAPLSEARQNLELAFNGMFYDAIQTNSYTEWAATYDSIGPSDRLAILNAISAWEAPPPVINVVMPTFNTDPDHLRQAVNSVRRQLYAHWRLLIADDASTNEETLQVLRDLHAESDPRILVKMRETNGHICAASNTALEMAEEGWVVFLDHDDLLPEHALFRIAHEIVSHPEARFIYSDSDKLSPDGVRVDPYYAPDFSYELLLAQNYVTHLSAYRLEGVRDVGGLQVGMEGSQDWDLALRYLEQQCGTPPDPKLIRHIPEVLYHWRQSETSTSSNIMNKPYAVDAGRRAVMQHLHRTKQAAFVSPHPIIPIFNLVRFLVTDPAPKVTVLIPTRDNADQLLRCVNSLLSNTVYGNFDVIVMDNGSTNIAAREALSRLADTPRVRVIRMPGPFNFAAMNNRAAKETDAEFICLLNDDTEIIERAWLNDMVGLASRPSVGAVGAKLIYPDNTVQEAGIMFSTGQQPGFSAMHMWQQLPAMSPGQSGRAVLTQPVLAVTGACMVIRRDIFLEFGFDETTFPVDYNDVDLCLRLHEAGYRNIVSAQSLVRHYEGQSKRRLKTWRRQDMLEAEQRLLSLHPMDRDPYVNPNLEFQPSLSTLAKLPVPKVWRGQDRTRVLIVNGGENEARQAFRNGELPFCASLEGHYLAFTVPSMENVQAIDLREEVDALATVLSKLGIDRIDFCGIGDGTLGSVGFFTALAERGHRIEFTPTEQANITNAHSYYPAPAWDSVWEKFHEAIGTNGVWLSPAAE